jgi:hypothetical protein
MRVGLVIVLCLVSAAIGAGIDHYWSVLVPASEPSHTGKVQTTSSPAPAAKDADVLGDRVRCDVRFSELHLPDSAYRSFFDKCMGNAATDADKPAR